MSYNTDNQLQNTIVPLLRGSKALEEENERLAKRCQKLEQHLARQVIQRNDLRRRVKVAEHAVKQAQCWGPPTVRALEDAEMSQRAIDGIHPSSLYQDLRAKQRELDGKMRWLRGPGCSPQQATVASRHRRFKHSCRRLLARLLSEVTRDCYEPGEWGEYPRGGWTNRAKFLWARLEIELDGEDWGLSPWRPNSITHHFNDEEMLRCRGFVLATLLLVVLEVPLENAHQVDLMSIVPSTGDLDDTKLALAQAINKWRPGQQLELS